jgi:hypothetical protein
MPFWASCWELDWIPNTWTVHPFSGPCGLLPMLSVHNPQTQRLINRRKISLMYNTHSLHLCQWRCESRRQLCTNPSSSMQSNQTTTALVVGHLSVEDIRYYAQSWVTWNKNLVQIFSIPHNPINLPCSEHYWFTKQLLWNKTVPTHRLIGEKALCCPPVFAPSGMGNNNKMRWFLLPQAFFR